MTKKIFRSIVLVAVCALLASLLLIMGCLYDYFTGLQSQALRDELTFAASGVSQSGEGYLDTLSSSQYRLTWIAADGTVLYDTQADAASMENHASREEVQQALATGEGERGEKEVTYNGKGKFPGHFQKTVTVRTNGVTEVVRLTIEGLME